MNNPKVSDCEVCGSSSVSLIKLRPSLAYFCCQECGHCLINSQKGLDKEFQSSQSLHFGESCTFLSEAPPIYESEILASRKKFIDCYIPPTCRIVEVGPGSGLFAALLKAEGNQVIVVEHSPDLAAAIRLKLSVQVFTGEFETTMLPPAQADVFCSFHVIEHVKNPLSHLQSGLAVVRPGGLALVATPNACSWQQKFFIRLSPNFDSAHLRVFSKASLKHLAELAGWIVEDEYTLDHTSSWLRVVSKAVRVLKGEDEELTAGKYSGSSIRFSLIYRLISFLTRPIRKLQSHLGGGNEVLLVLRRPK